MTSDDTAIDVLEIQERRKPAPARTASPDDFGYRKIGEADPSSLITDSTLSLYCLDPVARRALFVQVAEGVDLTMAPFLYMAQYDQAQRLLAVPYDVLHRVAAGVELEGPLVFIYSTGRAGSTLLSKAFREMGGVTSLSEPDVYTQAVALRLCGGHDEIRQLLTSATKILFNPAFAHGSSLYVVKFRSQGIELGDLLADAFPAATNLFLYRDLAPFIRSGVRAFAFDDRPPQVRQGILENLARMMPLLTEELQHRGDLSGAEIVCFMWLSAVHAYLRLQREGIPMLTLRYDDLASDPSGTLETIMTYLGLPAEKVQRALAAFERDSQAGSPFSREEAAQHIGGIDDRQWESIRDIMRRYPLMGSDIPRESLMLP